VLGAASSWPFALGVRSASAAVRLRRCGLGRMVALPDLPAPLLQRQRLGTTGPFTSRR
jgi:hypothetical protein